MYITAGVVCLMQDPIYKNIYLLLGKEGSTTGASSNTWCAMSGRADDTDESIEATAAREFEEESFAILPLTHLCDDLKQKRYLYKLQRLYNNGIATIYVKHVAFDPGIVSRFSSWRKNIDPICVQMQFLREQLASLMLSKCFIPRLSPLFHNNYYKYFIINITSRGGDNVEVTYQHTNGHFNICEYTFDDPAFIDGLLCAWCMFSEALRMFQNLPEHLQKHPCFVLHRIQGSVVYLDIRREFFEKSRLALWSIDRLSKVINEGTYEREHFRRSFTPFLATIVEQLIAAVQATAHTSSHCPSHPPISVETSISPETGLSPSGYAYALDQAHR